MRKYSMLILFVLLVMSLVACSKAVEDTHTKKTTPNLEEVIIYKMEEGTKKTNVANYEEMKQIQRAVKSASQQPGVVNMAETEYKIELENETYFIWPAREEGQVSTIMNVKDTHTIFTLSKKSTKEVNEILKKHKLL